MGAFTECCSKSAQRLDTPEDDGVEQIHLCARTPVAAYERTCAILGDGEAKDAWVSFAEGYIQFHLFSPRYRLRELLDIDYLLDETTY